MFYTLCFHFTQQTFFWLCNSIKQFNLVRVRLALVVVLPTSSRSTDLILENELIKASEKVTCSIKQKEYNLYDLLTCCFLPLPIILVTGNVKPFSVMQVIKISFLMANLVRLRPNSVTRRISDPISVATKIR